MITKKKNRFWIAWMMVLPVLCIRLFTTAYPLFMTFYNSFFQSSIYTPNETTFIGFGNYIKLFQDPKTITSLEFTAIFTIVSMVFHIVLGVLLALILNMKFAGKKFIRTIVLIPWAMPMVVAGLAARWAFNDTYGFINDLIRRFINSNFHMDWLVQTGTARTSVIAVDLWKDVPFFAILILASLQFISSDIYEAAKIDGAGAIKSFFYITVPSITKSILTLSVFFTMWRMTSFDVVYSMTSGGPGDSTSLLAYRIMLEAFTNLNLGYASTIAVLMFIIMAVLCTINFAAANRIKD